MTVYWTVFEPSRLLRLDQPQGAQGLRLKHTALLQTGQGQGQG